MKKIESGRFKQWLKKLKDETGKARIVSRINRLMEGLPGDVAPVGQGVSELRIHYGPGTEFTFTSRATLWWFYSVAVIKVLKSVILKPPTRF